MMKQNRKSLDELYARRFKLWRNLVNIADFVRGSVVVLRRPCVYPNCKRCQEGVKHPATYLSVSKNGKTQLIYLPKSIRSKVKQWNENYRKLQKILEEISEANIQIIKVLSKKNGHTTRMGGKK